MSEIKVNKISPRTACGTTTLGDSGDTITIPAGVTITNNGTAAGFGATGAASWDTTVKTTGFTAVDGVGYFVNTTAGAIIVTLPLSPAAGAVVAVSDYAGTSDTNAITIGRNGSNINGAAADLTVEQENSAVTLVYVDGTQGWKATDTSSLADIALTPAYITATGGTITCSGDYKIHTFTGPGTFCVSAAGNPLGSSTTDYMTIAGGGGGGYWYGAGGGGGGARMSAGTTTGSYSVGPLGACVSSLPVTVQGYSIVVGAGGGGGQFCGTPSPNQGKDGIPGNNSSFSTITSTGGGGGAGSEGPARDGLPGGSGGGATGGNPGAGGCGGTGNTPPVSPPQGQPGGNNSGSPGAGGGGATQAGPVNGVTNIGGNGVQNNINIASGHRVSCNSYYAGGGGPSSNPPSLTSVPLGGGVNGNLNVDATANTGGAGGGNACAGGNGGSGIVIIRYKYQN